MSDRVAFARLDHEALQRASADQENELAELRRELGVVTDERDTALTAVARLEGERDRAREECGHEKAMRAGIRAELMYHVGYLRDARAERDALSAVIDKAAARCDEFATMRGRNRDVESGARVAAHDIRSVLAAGVAAPAEAREDRAGEIEFVSDPACNCPPVAAPVGETPDEEQHVTLSVPVSNCKTPM